MGDLFCDILCPHSDGLLLGYLIFWSQKVDSPGGGDQIRQDLLHHCMTRMSPLWSASQPPPHPTNLLVQRTAPVQTAFFFHVGPDGGGHKITPTFPASRCSGNRCGGVQAGTDGCRLRLGPPWPRPPGAVARHGGAVPGVPAAGRPGAGPGPRRAARRRGPPPGVGAGRPPAAGRGGRRRPRLGGRGAHPPAGPPSPLTHPTPATVLHCTAIANTPRDECRGTLRC